MKCLEFRSDLLAKLRAFDSWAWRDEQENPDEYADFEFSDWMDLFKGFIQENSK